MHVTEEVNITFKGLSQKKQTFSVPRGVAQDIWQRIEKLNDSDSIPAHEVFPELADPVLRPAAMLRGGRYRENLTQKQLAEKLGIRQHHLSEMENAKRAISKEMALKLAEALRMDYKRFL